MHAVGLHSALAIKRQRKRREEQRRAKERRYSLHSAESGRTSPRASTNSIDYSPHFPAMKAKHSIIHGIDYRVATTFGMLHIGIVFLLIGVFLLISGFLPNDITTWQPTSSKTWWNELIIVGFLSLILGIVLISLNTIITKKEENEIEKYVNQQLTRSKSGHRLEKDGETGGMQRKRYCHNKDRKSDSTQQFTYDNEEDETQSSANENVTTKITENTSSSFRAKLEPNTHLGRITEEEAYN
ncbi:uncharacterized protein LOC106652826 [Trichogramma pretiosum]|uniref:uncharacterized protein LOC106652826 n=1 Tax=Trichogramma pretiosum TaxID=7493 RepID=UPI0006C9B57C|nr:uncharacterized protein LOC106652826 [Trichogramma pretiosum]